MRQGQHLVDYQAWLDALKARENGARVIIPGETVAFGGDGKVFFRAPPYKSLQVELVPELATVRFVNRRGRVPENSKAIIVLFHGTGAPYSHSGTMLSMLHTLTSEPSTREKGFVAELQKDPHYIPLAAEAIDLPGHGGGPELSDFTTVDKCIDWIAREFTDLKTFGLPIVPLVRSGAAALLVALNLKYPQLIDGLILMSPLHPAGLKHSNEYLEAVSQKPPDHPEFVVIRRPAIEWINRLYAETAQTNRWPQGLAAFADLPVLALMGMKDRQISPLSRQAFLQMTSPPGTNIADISVDTSQDRTFSQQNLTYCQIAGADHDVLGYRNSEEAKLALRGYRVVYEFLSKVMG